MEGGSLDTETGGLQDIAMVTDSAWDITGEPALVNNQDYSLFMMGG